MDTESRPEMRTSNRKGKSRSQVRSDETDRSDALQRSASNGDVRYQKRNSQRSKSLRKNNTMQQGSTEQLATTNYNPCITGPDFYANVLGPTADETILVGLETFMKFCQESPNNYERSVLVDSSAGLSSTEEPSAEEAEDGFTEDISELNRSSLQQDSDQSLTADEHFETSQISFDRQHSGKYLSTKMGVSEKYGTPGPTLESSRRASSRRQSSSPSTTGQKPSERNLVVPEASDRDSYRQQLSLRETTSREFPSAIRESSLRNPRSHSTGIEEEVSGKEFGKSISASRKEDASKLSTTKGVDRSKISITREPGGSRLSVNRVADGGRLSGDRGANGSRLLDDKGANRSTLSSIKEAGGSRLSTVKGLHASRLSSVRGAKESRLSATRGSDGSRLLGERGTEDGERLSGDKGANGSRLLDDKGVNRSTLSAIKGADGSRLSTMKGPDGSRLSTDRGADESRLSATRGADGSRLSDDREEDEIRLPASRETGGSNISASRRSGRDAANVSKTAFREAVEGSVYKEESYAPNVTGKYLTVPGGPSSNTSGRILSGKEPSRDLSRTVSPRKGLPHMSPSRDISENMEKKPGSTMVNSGRDISVKDISQRTISERGSTYRGMSEKNGSKRAVSIKNSISEEPPRSTFSDKVTAGKPLKESTSRDLSGRSATASRTSSRTATRQSGKVSKLSREESIPEELSDTFEKDSDEELLNEVRVEDEEDDVDFNSENLSTRHTSSRIIQSETSRPSTRTSQQQSDSYSSNQDSQTTGQEMRDYVSQTASMQGVGSSQTSEHSLTTRSQTEDRSSSPERHFATTRRAGEVQVYQAQTDEDELGKGKGRARLPKRYRQKDSTDTCSGCPCTQSRGSTSSSRPTVRINVCKCSVCKKQVQKPAVRRSCLKTSKCKCCTATAATTKSANNIPQKRQVKMLCECCSSVVDSVPSECLDQSPPSQMGDTSDECNSLCYKIRYAITKITKFYSYTTFEVMRSTSKKPKVMPKSLEGVFVLKNAASKSGSFEVA